MSSPYNPSWQSQQEHLKAPRDSTSVNQMHSSPIYTHISLNHSSRDSTSFNQMRSCSMVQAAICTPCHAVLHRQPYAPPAMQHCTGSHMHPTVMQHCTGQHCTGSHMHPQPYAPHVLQHCTGSHMHPLSCSIVQAAVPCHAALYRQPYAPPDMQHCTGSHMHPMSCSIAQAATCTPCHAALYRQPYPVMLHCTGSHMHPLSCRVQGSSYFLLVVTCGPWTSPVGYVQTTMGKYGGARQPWAFRGFRWSSTLPTECGNVRITHT
jgi:hypothetical protein